MGTSINGLFLTELLFLSLFSGQVLAASFYGDGYVFLRTSEVSSRTSLHVRFMTSCPSGVLFLSAGETDFLLLELHSGRLQVSLDLGSGERSLRSERGVRLDDLAWHSVRLQHDHHDVTLTVDRHAHTSLHLPGPDLELAIQDGLYVGGVGALDRPYLHRQRHHPSSNSSSSSSSSSPSGHSSSGFRGCLDEVLFNQHNLLASLRPYSGYKSVHEVSLGCSAQFSATEDEPFSFFSSQAFLSLPAWDVPQEGVFECDVRVPEGRGDGLVLYSSTHHGGGDGGFVWLEVREGRLAAVVGLGGRRSQLWPQARVDDQDWHRVRLRLLPHAVQLRVGEEEVNASLVPPSRPRGLQLSGPLYLGGVSDQARPEARAAGLLSGGGGSFKGCLRHVRVNRRKTGLPHATLTKDVSVGCEPEKLPEAPTTAADHLAATAQPTDRHGGADRKRNQPGLLLLTDLVVPEGGRAALEAKHIKVKVNFRRLGLRQSQLLFRVEEQPCHGQLRLDPGPGWEEEEEEEEEWVFGMSDLWHGRVMYVHGGSEDPQDFFMFSVFTSSNKQLPLYLRGNKLHRFNITVTPVNDAPELILPEGPLFMLQEKSSRALTTNLLRTSDPDTNATQLEFTVIGSLDAEAGHLEFRDHPGVPITTFSLPDLEEGKVSYRHTGAKTSQLALRVSDGEKVSNTAVLRVLAMQVDHHVITNTGLEVEQGGVAVLSSAHLAVWVTVDGQPVEVRFDMVEGPRYGELQRLHSGGEWKNASYFHQKLLDMQRVRYLNTFHGLQTGSVSDQFRCKVTIGFMATDEVVVPVQVSWIHYKVTRSKMEVDSSVQESVITPRDLHAVSRGVRLPESHLFFRLLTLPRKGHLLLGHRSLQENSTFSQKNVSDRLVRYEPAHRPQEQEASDGFRFQVFSRHAHSESQDFRISLRAQGQGQGQGLTLVNRGLAVLEGESRVITRDELFVQTAKTVRYVVTRGPAHGRIGRINLSNSTSVNDHIRTFTSRDLAEERIMYVHDDSETTADSFAFLATVAKSARQLAKMEDAAAVEGTFHISVQLVNDQKPVRVVDKVFHVVRGGQRLLTLNDVRYHDADADFDDGGLVYTRRSIPLGELVRANDTGHRLYRFTQAELGQGAVLFLHRGVSSGRFVLFVTDGKHYVSSLLEVLVQDAYVSVENNTAVRVQRGGATAVRPANLAAVTNQDVRDEREVTYEVFLPPRHGGLFLSGEGSEGAWVERFTQADLRAGRLAYRHDGSRVLADGFNVTVHVGEARANAGVRVRVFLESHQTAPTVRHHGLVVVEEGTDVQIHPEQLEVVHEDSLPSEILFTVKMAPAYGFLRRSANQGKGEESYQGTEVEPLHTFSQEDINHSLLQYIQTSPAHSDDSFLLDTTNGVTEVSDIRVVVDIIPLLVPLEVTDLTLDEGSSEVLTSEIVKVTNRHFEGINFLYHVTEPPRRGHIEHIQLPGVPVPSFTGKQVEQKYIRYVHDGSDTISDKFTLVVNDTSTGKHSLPCTLLVNVNPINDQPPFVTANRILRVWAGSVTEVTEDDLSAEDSDSEPDSLEFVVNPPSNGHLALASAPSRHILNFTQAHILTRQLVFVHTGASSGGFHFQVNDGVNFAPREIFSTEARPLVLTLEKNEELQVYPGSVTAISQKDLLVVTPDAGEMRGQPSVVFRVTSPPKLGRLVRTTSDETSSLEASTFTQSMVNQGLISYHQTHPESVGWTASDSFDFSVSSPPASLPLSAFHIHISYDHAHPPRHPLLLANTGAVVAEGSRVVINRVNLDASNLLGKLPVARRSSHQIWYHLTSLPRHGVIAVGDRNLTGDQAGFSQLSLDQSRITYVHDDSETDRDVFSFEVWVCPAGLTPPQRPQEEGRVVADSFNITVTSVNDQPPLLRSMAPGLRVAQGETVVLRPHYLQVEDHNTPPEEIHYRVISQPSSGHLFLGDGPRQSPPVASFSQADVNHGRLHFVQQGEPSAGVFYFSITKGHHRLLDKLLSLEVTEAGLRLVNNTGLEILQGHTSVVITPDHLAAQAAPGTAHAAITYALTARPRHGELIMKDQKVKVFTQEDVRSGRVVYLMTDPAAFNDSFKVTVVAATAEGELRLAAQEVRVRVRPLIYLREPVLVPSGIVVKLRKDTLDATELAALSGGDPLFRILSPPKHGELVKLPVYPGVGEAGQHAPVTEFTFGDVEQGRVAIKETIGNDTLIRRHRGNKTATGVMALNDSLVFLLSAGRVQPAVGELLFTIVPYLPIPPGVAVVDGAKGRNERPSRLPGRNRTTGGRGGGGAHAGTRRPHPPRAPAPKNHKHAPGLRWGNHTGRNHAPPSSSLPAEPGRHPGRRPALVESLPRPASDPLLIILPFLACLLLIVVLLGVIAVFRRRREKRARLGLLCRLAPPTSARDGSPYLGLPERSQAVPSVVVTPLTCSCPGSPSLPRMDRRHSLTPPLGPPVWEPLGAETPPEPLRSPTPSLIDNQYWV